MMLRHRHPRLVLFFGCGRRASNGRRFMVVEWMAGGSLHDRLVDPKTKKPWTWRVQAVLEVAQGLAYLHGEKRVSMLYLSEAVRLSF